MILFHRKIPQKLKQCCQITSNMVLRRHSKWIWKCGAVLLFLLFIRTEVGRQETAVRSLAVLQDPWDPSKDSPIFRMNDRKGEISEDFPIRNYFRMLRTPTGVCRKLARFGGGLTCRAKGQNSVIRDGDKLICVDPEMLMPFSPNPEDCTILSFGVFTDVSFDEDIRDANCRVHMFDILNYDPKLNDTFMTFHQIGIGWESVFIHSAPDNITVEVNTLDLLLHRFNLTTTLINVLKIDIEEAEWKVLEQLMKSDLLDVVGQIAVEVHVFHAMNKTEARTRRDNIILITKVLHDLESIGFRRVAYWDNARSATVKDEEGVDHRNAGELLLVNTRWYEHPVEGIPGITRIQWKA